MDASAATRQLRPIAMELRSTHHALVCDDYAQSTRILLKLQKLSEHGAQIQAIPLKNMDNRMELGGAHHEFHSLMVHGDHGYRRCDPTSCRLPIPSAMAAESWILFLGIPPHRWSESLVPLVR